MSYQRQIVLRVLRDIKLAIDIDPEDLEISTDKKLFEQVIINQVKNALKSIESKGIIRIEASRNDDKNTIRVIDNGPGITKEDMENIFIPFYSTKEGGSGIGLNISQQIIKKHQGSIHVFSEPSKNTIFAITLPSISL